jgi:nucleoside-diphosphate-sugar epimerase
VSGQPHRRDAGFAEAAEAEARANPELWRTLASSRVLLTGGTGFLGTWLLAVAAAAGRIGAGVPHVTIVGRDEQRLARAVATFGDSLELRAVQADVTREDSLPTDAYTHVLHAAAIVDPEQSQRDPGGIQNGIIEGARRLTAIAEESRCRLLLVSSGAVYGPQPTTVTCLEESGELAPLSGRWAAYASGKRVAEALCLDSKQAKPVVARVFSCVGYGMPLRHYAVGNMIRDLLAGRPLNVSNRLAVRTYLSAANCATWLWSMAAHGTPGTIYNVGGETPVTISEVAHYIASLNTPPAKVIEASTGKSHDRYVPCVARARVSLGLNITPWRDAVGACIRSVSKFPSWNVSS